MVSRHNGIDLGMLTILVGPNGGGKTVFLRELEALGVTTFRNPEAYLDIESQAELGDTFLTMALNDEQVIIETNSEYLVHRVRRRIAESETYISELLKLLYFFRRDQAPIDCRVTDAGTMRECPRGMFSVLAEEAGALLRAQKKQKIMRGTKMKKIVSNENGFIL